MNNIIKIFQKNQKNELYNLFGDTQYAFPYEWNKEILKKALALIPVKYSNHAIFLSIDDKIVEKYGTKFENCSEIFDHNKNAFVNGYCLLSVVMTFPVEAYNITRLIKIPLRFKILIPKNKLNDDKEYKTKFDIYSEWLKEIIDIIEKKEKLLFFVMLGIQKDKLLNCTISIKMLSL